MEAPDTSHQYLDKNRQLRWHRGNLMVRNIEGQIVGPCQSDCEMCKLYFESRPRLFA